jgi:biopolymer transport protein ExbB
MIGLLGTVTGMVFAFQQVADTQGAARAGELAEGIYTALFTTVGGLLVAIPSLAAFAVFRNRVDQLVAEVAYAAHHAMAPLKRALARKAPSARSTRRAAGEAE